MEWTEETPTRPGFYWWRRGKFKVAGLYCLYGGGGVLLCRRCFDAPSDPEMLMPGGEWFGPIKPPE